MPAPAIIAAAAKIAGKAVAKATVRKAAKSDGGLMKIIAGSVIVVITVPMAIVGLVVVTAFVVISSVTNAIAAGPGGTGGTGGQGTIPTCMEIRDPASVDGNTPNATWNLEQRQNAALIVSMARSRQVPYRALYTAMMTGMQESSLRNLPHGDAERNDTIGVFQIGPEHGTEDERMNVAWSTGNFLDRLFAVDGWEELDPWEAAHRAQINDRADDYRKWWEDGDALQLADRLLDGSKCATLPMDLPYDVSSGYGPRNINVPGASRWHPAWDFANGECNSAVYSARPGRVLQLGGPANGLAIEDVDTGAVLWYLHMWPGTELVKEGDTVQLGQRIGSVGNYGPSGGCHLDLRINVADATSDAVKGLPRSEDAGGPYGYVHPPEYMSLLA